MPQKLASSEELQRRVEIPEHIHEWWFSIFWRFTEFRYHEHRHSKYISCISRRSERCVADCHCGEVARWEVWFSRIPNNWLRPVLCECPCLAICRTWYPNAVSSRSILSKCVALSMYYKRIVNTVENAKKKSFNITIACNAMPENMVKANLETKWRRRVCARYIIIIRDN